MPVRVIERLASPRTASAEPVMVGETIVISGHAAQLSPDLLPLVDRADALDRALDDRARRPEPAQVGASGRATSSGGMSWMWGCDVSTRLMKLACRLASIADMKTMTATPIATAVTMKIVCIRPSLQEAQGRDPLEGHPAVHGTFAGATRALIRAPSLTVVR